jgi:hypothetical protein
MITLSVARQRLSKNISMTTDMHATKRDIVGDGVFNAVSGEATI